MQQRQLAIGIAFIVWATTAAAAAQPDNPYGGGTRFTGPPPAEIPSGTLSPEDRARLLTQRFAACSIKAHRTAVLKAIEPEPWQSGALQLLQNSVDAKCLARGELQIPPDLLRGAFYQELYREKFHSSLPALPAAALDFAGAATSNLADDAKTQVALRQFGDCVARRDLNDAHVLILATPGSEQETFALTALMPHFGACLVRGSKWTLNRSSVSAILSEVIYREASAAPEAARK